jgi:NAD-dependent dihydropyrimidine dehydrogenase PreA subunit
MIRKIIQIDEEKCNGCGICITGCHEGALEIINGKAKLVTDSYCDGLGACLPACPTNALNIIEREAEAFDEVAVENNMKQNKGKEEKKVEHQCQPSIKSGSSGLANLGCGCPGSNAKAIERNNVVPAKTVTQSSCGESQLRQWPVQIKLVPANAPYLNNSHILVAADCTAYAYANIHNEFMKNKITLIGCPKLDEVDYAEKLAKILQMNEIKSVTVLRMEVPCCGGIVSAVTNAMHSSGKIIPWNVITISTDGTVIE